MVVLVATTVVIDLVVDGIVKENDINPDAMMEHVLAFC